MEKIKVGIIGSGSWGMALAQHMALNGIKVDVWSYDQEEARLINEERKCMFLPELIVDENIVCYTDIEKVVDGAKYIFHVTPSKFTRNVFKQYKDLIGETPVVICSKGFEKDSLKSLDDVILEEKEDINLAILTGPSHAEEVSKQMVTALVVASKDENLRNQLQHLLSNDILRVYTSTDIKGTELGGALKNIIAFCAGIADGIGLGDNAFAALITRGLNEMARLGVALGGNLQTFYGLSGLGDLVVTCLSKHSRNRRAGKLIAQGKSIEETRREVGMVIEALDNIDVAYNLARKLKIETPIINGVYEVINDGKNPKDVLSILMNRDKKEE